MTQEPLKIPNAAILESTVRYTDFGDLSEGFTG